MLKFWEVNNSHSGELTAKVMEELEELDSQSEIIIGDAV